MAKYFGKLVMFGLLLLTLSLAESQPNEQNDLKEEILERSGKGKGESIIIHIRWQRPFKDWPFNIKGRCLNMPMFGLVKHRQLNFRLQQPMVADDH